MRQALLFSLLLSLITSSLIAQEEPHSRLLLTAQRLKRLKRERSRQSPRWIAFEERIKSVSDSPERGFELALYYAVTGESARAEEAALWAKSHTCELRQIALINDVLETPVPAGSDCQSARSGPIARMRDVLFIGAGRTGEAQPATDAFLKTLRETSLQNAEELYAASEYVTGLRNAYGIDIRESASQLFNSLPVQFLLSLKPAQVNHPDWQVHIAALALIGLDPNSDSAQFLQGWAIEDRQMVREGQGVAYELLWADPYLPGVGYQNLDPWWYDEENSRLLARTDWTLNACSIKVSPGGVESNQCSPGWEANAMKFGRLTLIPMTQPCLQVPQRPSIASIVLWKLPANSRLRIAEDKKPSTQQVDRAGMWRVSSNISGKVCTVR